MMKLYGVVGSNNTRKVLAVINHLGLDVDIEYLDFFQGDLTTPEYMRLNPNAMVPTLEDDGFVLWELNAISQYLAGQEPGNTLFPEDQKIRADIVRWQCWELAHYNKAFGNLVWETMAKPQFMGMEPDEALAEAAKVDLARFAAVLEKHLEGREYLVNGSITLADYSVAHIEWFKETVPFDWSPYPNVNAYYERMRAVPYWADTAPSSPDAVGKRPAVA